MRLYNEVKIDEKRIGVKEIIIAEVIEIYDFMQKEEKRRAEKAKEEKKEGEEETKEPSTIFLAIERLLGALTNLKLADLRGMAPSEILKVINGVKEVNKGFFEIAASLGLKDMLETMIKTVKERAMSEIQKAVMGKLPGSN